MSVIIRLQNLPWSANALDIRQFFHGLSIPEGGVHIVGGEQGDAFIAFSTDEDARQAFGRTNGKIKEVQVQLMLSSRQEMQKVIAAARAQSYAAFAQPMSGITPLPAAVPAILPSAIPDIKKDDNKRDRRRSRSRSRDRKDRSRRHRSRSRSRERRDRRRRDRSRSRDRDRNSRDERRSRDSKKVEEKQFPPVWAHETDPNPSIQLNNDQMSFAARTIEEQNSTNVPVISSGNGFLSKNTVSNRWTDDKFNNQNEILNRNLIYNIITQRVIGATKFIPNHDAPKQEPVAKLESEENNCVNSCVKLYPFYAGYSDIRRFFQGLFISNKGIKFINDDLGYRTGIVYIQFGHTQGKLAALRKNGEILNGLEVTVTSLDQEQFENAVDRFTPPEDAASNKRGNDGNLRYKNISKHFNKQKALELKEFSCVTVDDLPTYVKEQDILHMFSVHPIFSLILTHKPRGGHIAYVKFSTQEEAEKAFKEKQHHVISGKPVTVRPCTDEDFEKINKAHEVDISGSREVDIGTDCVLVSKLPQNIMDRDIEDFFSDVGVIPMKIHLVEDHLGFAGEAYCEFESNADASKAVKKNDTVIGNIHISVKPVSRKEIMSYLSKKEETEMKPQIQSDSLNQNRNVHMNDNPPRSTIGNLQLDLNSRGPPPPYNNHRPFFNRNFGGPGFMGNRGGPRFGHRGGGPRFRFNPPPPQHHHMDHMDSMMDNNDDPPEGCTVYMDNVPYKAGTTEILEFFDGYNITHNVSRRYNANNTPSPEARVVFHSPDEAYRAIQERNGAKIWDRTIYLKQA